MKYIKLIIKIVISFGALYYVLHKIDINEVINAFKGIRLGYVVLAIIFFLVSKLIAANRLNFLFRAIGIHISALSNYKLYLMGMFYNLFLPGGIGGDGYKLYILNRSSRANGKWIFWTLLWDRLFGVIALVLLLVILSYLVKGNIIFRYYQWILLVVIPVMVYVAVKYLFSYLKKATIRSILLSLSVQLMQLVSCFFILKSVYIQELYYSYLFLFLLSSIVAALPISIGGMGAREITFLYGSQFLFLEESLAITVSLIFYLITAIVSVWGIIYSFNINRYIKPQTASL